MIVSDLMSKKLVTILPEDTVENAARLLGNHDIGALPVCSLEGSLRGMVTDRDIALRCIAQDYPPSTTMVKGIMSRQIVTIDLGADARQAAQLMAETQVRRLPVTENGKVVGIISLGDLAKSGAMSIEAGKALEDISSGPKLY